MTNTFAKLAAASGALALGIHLGLQEEVHAQPILTTGFYVFTDANGVAYDGNSFSGAKWESYSRAINASGYFEVNQSGPGKINNFKFSIQKYGPGVNNYSSHDPNSDAELAPPATPNSWHQGDIKASVTAPGSRCYSAKDCRFLLPVQTTPEQGRGYIGGRSAPLLFNINNYGLSAASYKSGQLVKANPSTIKTSGNASGGTGFNNTTFLSAGIILPAFEGGTLTVDQDNSTITQNFTVDDSPTNAIDVNGLTSEFSGSFSNKTNNGVLSITNSKTGGSITLSGRSTFKGFMYLDSGTNVSLAAANALSSGADLIVYRNSNLDFNNHDQSVSSLGGSRGVINLGSGTLTLGKRDPFTRSSGAVITGTGNLIKNGAYTQVLSGASTYTGSTTINSGTLVVNGSITSETTVNPGATLGGTGTIASTVYNYGTVSPGNSIGTLTIDGDFGQISIPGSTPASLEIEVDGSNSDLLKITGDNRTILLGGNLNISSYNNAAVSPGHVYTAIDVTGNNATGGELGLTTNLNVVGSSGMKFVRETDREFRLLDPAYYATCTSNDPAVQVGCTKLQFAWLKVHPDTGVAVNPDRHKTPGQSTIKAIKQTGGALTTASSGNSSTNTNTCIANGGSAASCQQQNKTGSGSGAHNANSTNAAKTLDAGWASLGAAVSSGVTGGSAIGTTGYTTNQTSAALVTPDFANVIAAFFSIPTRIELNQALHSITAEPYASMQSVALEAMEQFGKNSLALTDRSVPLTHTQTFCKTDDGSLVPADSPERPDTCDAREKTVGSRWSLLLDGSNTEANLNGTSELASLDYNVFSTIYGLQYAFSPEWSAGAAFGYGQANLYNYEYANAHINADTYSGSIWGIYRPSADWKISGLLGYMNLQYDSTRQMAFGGLNRTANANWDGNGFTTALEAQYNWALNGNNSDPNAIRLKPKTFLAYAVHNQGSFSESGAQSLNLAIDSHTADSVLWGLGFTLETPIRLSSSNRIIPRFTVGYEHDFMGSADEEHQLSSSFSELPALGSIDVLGQNRGADALDLGLSIEIETSDSVSLYAAVNGGFWSNGTEVSYGGGLKYAW